MSIVLYLSFPQQVHLVQDLIDGVELLIDMEKRLERHRSIEDLMPSKLRR